MIEQVVLSNSILNVTISKIGAELMSVKKDNEEYIWIGDPETWKMHAPLLFPIVGMVKDNKYVYNGTEYNLQYHGYGRFLHFEIESLNAKQVVFLHRFDAETLKVFPFKYELRVIYTLDGISLRVEYRIKNLDSREMYFSIGAHEGYYCPEGIEAYSVIFEKPESLDCSLLTGGLLEYRTENIGMNIIEFPLKYEYFKNKALIFLNLRSKEISLRNRNTGKRIKVKIDDKHTAFTLWTSPERKYICLEPWCGLPDFIDSDYNIENKKGIITLAGHAEAVRSHEIVFESN